MQMSETKLGRLDDLLTSTHRYSLETLDGLFSAALVGPVDVDVEACMAVLELGGATPWASDAERDEAAGLLRQFWQVIAARVAADPVVLGEDSLPFIDSPEEFDHLDDVGTYTGDFPIASDWAVGFRFALNEWGEEWADWMDESLYPFIGMLMTLSADQTDPTPDMPALPLPSFEERMGLLNEIPFQLARLYRRRHPAHGKTVRNEGDKVGRNDPCPCGSGKKFKKCCGSPG
ncbi:MAG TPA: UPF0149 family protein [Luteibacter sp.]|uniref:UPF0149 family protein n=1 Tax=Luteibacter sp. TaxID=1886636 RepID=UPI002C51B58A|nr:UPF0149 family protein [Luteibacter sp.]HVI56501.1 UPF0149 family protein [Luteibacter sp.]